jgi:ribosomal protein S27E
MASERAASRRAPPFIDPPGYARHRPEATLLYQLVEQYYPALLAAREATGRPLPGYVQAEFEAYLKCGRLEHGFLRVRCEDCHAEKLVAFSCKRRGFCPSCGARRMVSIAAASSFVCAKAEADALSIVSHMAALEARCVLRTMTTPPTGMEPSPRARRIYCDAGAHASSDGERAPGVTLRAAGRHES